MIYVFFLVNKCNVVLASHLFLSSFWYEEDDIDLLLALFELHGMNIVLIHLSD